MTTLPEARLLDQLEHAVASGDDDKVLDVIDQLGSDQASQAITNRVKQLTSETDSPRIRNAGAMALVDLHVPHAAELLIELLKRPQTKKARGTLLYALKQLGARVPLLLLVQIISEEGYEAREEALDIIRHGKGSASAEKERTIVRDWLIHLSHSQDDHLQRVAQAANRYLRRRVRLVAKGQKK